MGKRKQYLKLLGVPDYLLGDFDFSAALASPVQRVAPASKARPVPAGTTTGPSRPPPPPVPARKPRSAPARKPGELPKITIPLSPAGRYRPNLTLLAGKEAPIKVALAHHSTQPSTDNPLDKTERANWDKLRQEVLACTLCPLHHSRKHAVFGDGFLAPRLVIVGEAPGADEDFSGLPFVGRSGRLLTSMIDAMGFERTQVFICNSVKCRPPSNRNPHPDELDACAKYLDRQLAALKPQAILVLGAVAAQSMLKSELPVGKLRNRQHSYKVGERSFPLFVSYHPSYLLRQGSRKQDAWSDLKLVMRFFMGVGVDEVSTPKAAGADEESTPKADKS